MAELPPVVLVKGADHGLRARALSEAVEGLLGDDDRSLALAEFELPPQRGGEGESGGADARRAVVAAALDSARTLPFGTAKRIVVVRSDDGLLAAECEPLVEYLADPEPTSVVVLELPGRVPAALAKAAKAVGAEDVAVPSTRNATGEQLEQELERAGIGLERDAVDLVTSRLGEEAGRVPGVVDVLKSTFGEGARLGAEDVRPYLGEGGGIPVFELTKAIDAGDQVSALLVLQRLTGAMRMHPLQVMAILHNHYQRILRVDDAAVRNEEDAVAALGGRVKAYPAKLAWQKARELGTTGVRRAFEYLARADLDLRGATGAPATAVVEVLVTRLALLSSSRRGARARPRR